MSRKTTVNPSRKDIPSFNSAFEHSGGQQGRHNPGSITPTLQQHHDSLPTANYTLPGVISYLTSEFTHLERFKITTNLEKSEMRYKILQLTSEVNTLRFINDKQQLRIKELEAKLGMNGNISKLNIQDVEIPPVDLDILQKSRTQLNKLIRDVLRVLRPPLAISKNYLNAPKTLHSIDLDELLDDSEKFLFETDVNEGQDDSAREGIFSRYINDSNNEDFLLNSIEKEAQRLVELVQSDLAELNAPAAPISRKAPPSDDNETDTETVIVDEAEEALSKPKLNVSFGQEVRLLARNCIVFEPFEELLVFLEGSQVTVLQLGEPVFKNEIDLSSDNVVGIYYLGKKRLLLVTLKAVTLHTYKDASAPTTRVLVKDERVVVDACSLVEIAAVNTNRHYGLACLGMGKDGKLVISVYEIKCGQKNTSRLLGQFNSTFLKASVKVKDVKWAKKESVGEESDELPYDLVILHEKIQRLNVSTKELSDIKAEADFHSITTKGNLLFSVQHDSVEMYDLAKQKVVGVLPRHKHATYVLFSNKECTIAEVLDQLVLFNEEMQEVSRNTSPIHSPKGVHGLEAGDGSSLIIHGGDSISIIPISVD